MKWPILILLWFPNFLIGKQPATPPPAQEIFLAHISGDYNQNTYDLILEVNHKGLIQAIKTRNNKKNKIKRYSLEVIERPIPLVKAAGIILVSLKCLRFKAAQGCDIHIEYPSNISIGQFKHFKSKLKRSKEKWGLYANGKIFSKMHIVSKKFLGLPVGIKQIQLGLFNSLEKGKGLPPKIKGSYNNHDDNKENPKDKG